MDIKKIGLIIGVLAGVFLLGRMTAPTKVITHDVTTTSKAETKQKENDKHKKKVTHKVTKPDGSIDETTDEEEDTHAASASTLTEQQIIDKYKLTENKRSNTIGVMTNWSHDRAMGIYNHEILWGFGAMGGLGYIKPGIINPKPDFNFMVGVSLSW